MVGDVGLGPLERCCPSHAGPRWLQQPLPGSLAWSPVHPAPPPSRGLWKWLWVRDQIGMGDRTPEPKLEPGASSLEVCPSIEARPGLS